MRVNLFLIIGTSILAFANKKYYKLAFIFFIMSNVIYNYNFVSQRLYIEASTQAILFLLNIVCLLKALDIKNQ
jgi:hypothetical protein